jgi:hypothetical protein
MSNFGLNASFRTDGRRCRTEALTQWQLIALCVVWAMIVACTAYAVVRS